MKFTVVLVAALSVSASWALKVKNTEDPKDKREASIGYPSHSSQSFQAPALGHGEASAISVGAGYSVGGAKPSYSFGGQGGDAGLQLSSGGLAGSDHGTIQLAPITLQPGQGFGSSDLSQLMAQLSHGLNSGAISLQAGDSYQLAPQGGHGAQEYSLPQFGYGSPNAQQYAVSEQPSVPSYAAGTKGLGSYSTGPVLFSPSDSHGNAPTLSYGTPSSGQSFGGASGSGHSFGGAASSGHSFGGAPSAGHSFGGAPSSGHSFGGASSSGHSLGSAPSSGHSFGGLSSGGHSFGGGAISLGGSGHSFPGLSLGAGGHSFGGALKGYGASYGAPSKTAFKPSAFIGASVQGDSGHGHLSGLSGSYGTPSFGSFGGSSHGGLSLSSAGHGPSGGSFGGFGGGSSKFVAQSYLPAKSEGFGSSLESVASFSSDGHLSSPPGTTYGHPTSSYGLPSNSAHAASSSSPQYHVPSKSSFPSFTGSSQSYKAPYSGHSLSSFSSGPKYSFGGHNAPSSRYGSPSDIQGAHSETAYNTIKYSEELKPRAH